MVGRQTPFQLLWDNLLKKQDDPQQTLLRGKISSGNYQTNRTREQRFNSNQPFSMWQATAALQQNDVIPNQPLRQTKTYKPLKGLNFEHLSKKYICVLHIICR